MPTTWNPNDKGADLILTNLNLTAIMPTGIAGYESVRSTTSKTTGKWYFEIYTGWRSGDTRMPGIMTPTGNINDFPGATNQSYGLYYDAGIDDWWLYFNNSGTNVGGFAANGDALGICLDLNSNFLYYTLNGANLLGDPVAGTGGQAIAAGTWYAAVGGFAFVSFNPPVLANFGASGFGGRLPTGFTAWDISPFNTKSFGFSATSFTRASQPMGT